MSFQALIAKTQTYFPRLQVKYKNESTFMKLIAFLLFFNKRFMKFDTTTVGASVYFPTRAETVSRPLTSAITLLHEVVHIYDTKKVSSIIFRILYLTPYRIHYEKRAYISSLYVINALSIKNNFKPLLSTQKNLFLSQFRHKSYYFMWPFKSLDQEFEQAVTKIKAGERPFEDPVFDILDDLIKSI